MEINIKDTNEKDKKVYITIDENTISISNEKAEKSEYVGPYGVGVDFYKDH